MPHNCEPVAENMLWVVSQLGVQCRQCKLLIPSFKICKSEFLSYTNRKKSFFICLKTEETLTVPIVCTIELKVWL